MSDYPEAKPEGLSEFRFAIVDKHVTEDVRLRREALESRIKRISDKCRVDIGGQQVPLLDNIAALRISKSDLKNLAAGLDRVADLIDDLDKLRAQESVLEMAQADPKFFTWAFGLVNNDVIDDGINNIENYLKSTTSSEE